MCPRAGRGCGRGHGWLWCASGWLWCASGRSYRTFCSRGGRGDSILSTGWQRAADGYHCHDHETEQAHERCGHPQARAAALRADLTARGGVQLTQPVQGDIEDGGGHLSYCNTSVI
eukprot:256134-Rhodomonas_salina.4